MVTVDCGVMASNMSSSGSDFEDVEADIFYTKLKKKVKAKKNLKDKKGKNKNKREKVVVRGGGGHAVAGFREDGGNGSGFAAGFVGDNHDVGVLRRGDKHKFTLN